MSALGIVTGAFGVVWSVVATVLRALFGFLNDFKAAASVAIFGWCVRPHLPLLLRPSC